MLILVVLIHRYTYTNKTLQIQCHNAECAEMKRFLCSHYNQLQEEPNTVWKSMPFRLINLIAQIRQFRMEYLTQEEENEQ